MQIQAGALYVLVLNICQTVIVFERDILYGFFFFHIE